MNDTVTVKVSSRNQIAVPKAARERLGIQPGDRLIVDIQDDVLILVPEPKDYVRHMEGLHKEIWEDVDTDAYLRGEREAWER